MVKFTTDQRVKIIEFCFENGRSIVATQRPYMRHFNVRHRPSRPALMSLVMRFQGQGSVNDRSRRGRGLSDKVYVNKPQIIQELKANIRQEILSLKPPMLRTVMENSLERARLCQAENGGYLKDIIFRN